jgi:hypothetical protein
MSENKELDEEIKKLEAELQSDAREFQVLWLFFIY